MSAALDLQHVTKHFRGSRAPAVADLCLTVDRGACTAILGPSGSGKSTVLRLIAGLEMPDDGIVLIGEQDVAAVPAERRGVGMVFQKSLLFPHLSALDNVAFAARVGGAARTAARARAIEYLDMVQLRGFGSRRVGELSGGQEQRVAIARALAAEPAVLLLDEPFSALDAALRADMHALIDEIRLAVGPTIVLVTHDRDEASRVADRIAVLEHGTLLHEGTVADAYRAPSSVRVAQLMGGRNEIVGVVTDGVHRSPLGAVPCDSAPGTAVLLVRQEDIIVHPAGYAPGREDQDAGAAAADGGAVVLGAGASPRAVRDATRVVAEATVTGAIESSRVSGARTEVAVRCAPDLMLHAEIPASWHPRLGDAVELVIPHAAVHVVAG